MQNDSAASNTSYDALTAVFESSCDARADLVADATHEEHRASPKTVALEAQILAVFTQPRANGESHEIAFKRKEHELATLFAELVPAESLALEERLRLATPGDAIAAQFGRLVAERQARLIAFLAYSRKRHPLQHARARQDDA